MGMEVTELIQLLQVFADDTLVVAGSWERLCQLVTEFVRVLVNVGKSKVMRCSRDGPGARLNVILIGDVHDMKK